MMQRKPANGRKKPARTRITEPSLRTVKLVVGLGNPGEEYRKTYHNAGILFTAYLAENAGAFGKAAQSALVTMRKNGPYWVADTKTFMNESGLAVRAALTARKLRPEALLVAHDDSDIPLGEFKFAFGRGAAGHRGVASVIAALGTNQFWRLRIGVRSQSGKAGAFVLRRISPAHGDTLAAVCGIAYRKLAKNVTP